MLYYTDDPVSDYERYSAELEGYGKLLPDCDDCGERITDDYCYTDGDTVICEECLKRNYRKSVDDLIGW